MHKEHNVIEYYLAADKSHSDHLEHPCIVPTTVPLSSGTGYDTSWGWELGIKTSKFELTI